jgi:hypothetical protein
MKNLNRKLTATPNYSARTFTLRVAHADGSISKYRTYPTSKSEFEQDLNNTEDDWFYFLKSDSYYTVK